MSWREHKMIRRRALSEKQGRIKVLAVFFIIFAVIIIIRLFDLQVFKGNFYAALAVGQHELFLKLFPERGKIYVVENNSGTQSLFPLVTNRDLNMLYAVPQDIESASTTAAMLFAMFGLPEEINVEKAKEKLFADIPAEMDSKMAEEIKTTRFNQWLEEQKKIEIEKLTAKLSKPDDPYEPLKHKVTDEQKTEIKSWDQKGLAFKDETWRFYPEKGMGGQVFGFWTYSGDTNRVGQYGLEGYFDEELTGKFGEIHSERDAIGNIIAIGNNSLTEKTDGSDLVLTIDRAIQYQACAEIKHAVEWFRGSSGSVIVMNPKTGAILAMCGAPDFDPYEYNRVDDINIYNNPAIFDAWEPGSIFKPFTMAAALDVGKIEPTTTYVDTGGVKYGPYTIKNYADKVYGTKTMTEVLESSINTGTIFAMQQATPEVFKQYVKDFGFGQKTGLELEKEIAGDISNLNQKGEIYSATASFGQGISITPIQMVSALSAIANGGKLMKPYIVSQIIHSDGQIETFQPKEVRQVIKPQTAAILSGMMVSVVEKTYAKSSRIEGYRLAGKTGTAQRPNKNSSGYSAKVSASFIGFGSFADPQFAIVVRVDDPEWGKTGEAVAAPVFKNIAKFILQYYNVPYDSK